MQVEDGLAGGSPGVEAYVVAGGLRSALLRQFLIDQIPHVRDGSRERGPLALGRPIPVDNVAPSNQQCMAGGDGEGVPESENQVILEDETGGIGAAEWAAGRLEYRNGHRGTPPALALLLQPRATAQSRRDTYAALVTNGT